MSSGEAHATSPMVSTPDECSLRGRRAAHVQKVARRRGPHEVAVVLRRDVREGVRLAEVAAELREYLVPRDADGHRAAQLRLDAAADLGRRAHRVPAQKRQRPREVEPALVEAERLHQVGVVVVDAPRQARIALVHVVARRHHDEPRALRARLPQRLARLHAGGLRLRALREHDAVARLLVAAHHQRPPAQLRALGLLHARVERVHVGMEDHAVHVHATRRPDRTAAERLADLRASRRRRHHPPSPSSTRRIRSAGSACRI